MTSYAVQKNVPIPAQPFSTTRYPFGTMQVGDSFALAELEVMKVRPAAAYWGKRHGTVKFSIRRSGDGYRCWRTA